MFVRLYDVRTAAVVTLVLAQIGDSELLQVHLSYRQRMLDINTDARPHGVARSLPSATAQISVGK